MALLDLYALDGNSDRILVTCALPYVNNVPHLGNLVPVISADVYSRYLRKKGIRCLYICATDEHGTRTEIEAAAAGLDEETYCRGLHDRLLSIFSWFNVEFSHFGRTSSGHNHRLTQELFLRADARGFVEPQTTHQLFCERCRRYLPDTYVEGICPICQTPGAKGDQCDQCQRFLDPLELGDPRCKVCGAAPEVRTTEHLALRLDALAPRLDAWLVARKDWEGIIVNMPRGWIREGLKPRGITRDLRWGVPVPKEGFEDKVFYVWFDAPIGYIAATAEWAQKAGEDYRDWWRGGRARLIHFLGKDNVPFHTLMWPGTLLAADDDWNLPDYIAANEYLAYEGGAFSKSRNRGVFADQVVAMGFAADALRFYLMANRPEKRDTNFSFAAFAALVNTDLVGNFGNLANRLLSFMHKRVGVIPEPQPESAWGELEHKTRRAAAQKQVEIDRAYATFELRAATRHVLELSDIINGYFQAAEPWRTWKQDQAACRTTLYVAGELLAQLAGWMWPLMPERSEKLLAMLGCGLQEPYAPGRPVLYDGVLFNPVEESRVDELELLYRGAGEEPEAALVFSKQLEVTWPCVILELTELKVRRKVKALERFKDEFLRELDVVSILDGERLRRYETLLGERDRGDRAVSVRNLAEIYAREGRLPNINAVVDVYNAYSLKHALVMGAYERRTIRGRLIYAQAAGDEHFVPVKGEAREPVAPGEWVLKDASNMVVTKIVSKQSEAAAVTTATTACAMCIQGTPDMSLAELEAISTEMAERLVRFCGGQFRVVHVG